MHAPTVLPERQSAAREARGAAEPEALDPGPERELPTRLARTPVASVLCSSSGSDREKTARRARSRGAGPARVAIHSGHGQVVVAQVVLSPW